MRILQHSPKMERLERREVPATLTIDSGALTLITDDSGENNVIHVCRTPITEPPAPEEWYTVTDSEEGITCSIPGAQPITDGWKVPVAGITRVWVDAKAGDDFVEGECLPVDVTFIGREGNDTLIGGAGNDLIDGGLG